MADAAEAPYPVQDPDLKPEDDKPKGKPARQLTEEQRRRMAEGGRRGGHATARARARERPEVKERLDRIEEELAGMVGTSGLMIMPMAPLPGGYMIKTSDELAGIVRRLAADNPRFLEALDKAGGVMQWVPLATWSAGLVTAFAAQYGFVHPEGIAAEQLGVADVYREQVAEGIVAPSEPMPEPEPGGGDGAGVGLAVPPILADGNGAG